MSASHTQQPWWKNSRGEWYVVLQMVLFALIAVGPESWTVKLDLSAPLRVTLMIVGFLLGAVGLLLALAGLFGLGNNLSILPHPKDDATLVQSGPYRLVRHPIYGGLIIGAVGWALLNTSVITLVYALTLLVFFDIKARREERWLMRKFPDYAAYRARVHKLIPFLY